VLDVVAAGVDVADEVDDDVDAEGPDDLLLPQPVAAAPTTNALAARPAATTDTFIAIDSLPVLPISRAT
jgi:hypothetical protein